MDRINRFRHLSILLLLLLIISCEKEILSTQDILPVYETEENNEIAFEFLSELTTPPLSRIDAYPNPFYNVVSIHSGGIPELINISDKDGRIKKFQPSDNNSSYDFSEAKPGVYYCEVLLEGRIVRLQLFKLKN